MSSVDRPDDAGPDGPARYAPKWLRDERQPPLRSPLPPLPDAPQFALPPLSHALPPKRDRAAFEGDLALRHLLTRQSLNPQPVPEPPRRERNVSYLGMIGRLVAAIAIAAPVALFVVGAIPIPFWTPQPLTPERAAPTAFSDGVSEEPPLPTKITSRLGVDYQQLSTSPEAMVNGAGTTTRETTAAAAPQSIAPPAGAAVLASAGPATVMAPVDATTIVPQSPPRNQLKPEQVAALVRRGEAFIAERDVPSARLVLQRAAEAGDARGALALAATYDPNVLTGMGTTGVKPDLAQARA